MAIRRIALVTAMVAVAGCGGSPDEGAAPATVTVTQSPSVVPTLDPHECQDPAVAEANPELCGDVMVTPPEIPADEGAEWPDGLRAEIVDVVGRPYEDPQGDLMLSFTWELSNAGTDEIPLGEGGAFSEDRPFDAQIFFGENRTEAVGYLPNEGDACVSDLPQRLVPGSSVRCLIDFLVESDQSELRAEVMHNGELLILTGVERLVGE